MNQFNQDKNIFLTIDGELYSIYTSVYNHVDNTDNIIVYKPTLGIIPRTIRVYDNPTNIELPVYLYHDYAKNKFKFLGECISRFDNLQPLLQNLIKHN